MTNAKSPPRLDESTPEEVSDDSIAAARLIESLAEQQVTLWLDRERLRYRAPQEALTPELKARIADLRPSIIALLRQRAEDPGGRPLSAGQQSLWFIQQTAADSAAYNVSFAARILPPFEPAAFKRALAGLQTRHPQLRTTFAFNGEQPVQKVDDSRELPLEEVDATAWTPEELLVRVRARRDRPFDLEKEVFRAHLFACARGEYVLLLVIHHIVVDLWSLTILLDELGELYSSEVRGATSALPELGAQYGEFVAWQSTLSKGDEALWDYWNTQLAGELPVLDLPLDRPRPPVQTFRGDRQTFAIDDETTRGLKRLAQQQGATLNALLLAAFQVLLHRHSGQEDLLVGSLTSGRNDDRFVDTVGYFVNPVALRSRCNGETAFRTFAEQSRRGLLSAIEHQDYPFARLIERLQPNRDPSRSPLFQAMFVLQRPPRLPLLFPFAMGEPGVRMELGELSLESIALGQDVTRFDLELMMTDLEGRLLGYLQYNADLYDRDTIARLTGHFQTLLRGIVANPDEQVARLPMLTPEETSACQASWSGPAVPIAPGGVHELVLAQVHRSPEAVAITCGADSLSYAELARRADLLSARLRAAGVGQGDLVGIALQRSPDMVAAVLAVWASGAAYVPLDPTHPGDRLAGILEDAGIKVLLSEKVVVSGLPAHGGQVVCIDDDPPSEPVTIDRDDVRVSGDDLAYIIYTSGSTGKPKGVEITHGAVVNFLASMRDRIRIEAADVLLAITTLAFDIAGLELFLPLTVGATVALARSEQAQDGSRLAQLLVDSRATILQATPSTWQMLLDSPWKSSHGLTALCGGEALPRELADRLLPRVKTLWNVYGPTETTIWSLAGTVLPGNGPIELGAPLDNTQIYVLDAHGQRVPSGVTGELYIGGAGLARGYHNRPELTAERFVPNHFDPEGRSRLYRTGDLVRYRPNGAVEYLGRTDHQVKLRGFRIELGEIDATLGRHADVRQAASVLVGDGVDKQIVSFVVLEDSRDATRRERDEWYGERVADWQAVWDERDRQSRAQSPKRFDITGWNSSYTGAPLSEEEMREWVQETVDDVLAWAPRSVLDIGCKTGLFLFELAERCERYVGVDSSAEALGVIDAQLTPQEKRRVALLRESADDLRALAGERFDVVMLNSVIQYFPSVAYLMRALEAALEATKPGGVLYVGDVRSLPLLEAFHASVAFQRASDSQTVDQLRKGIQEDVAREEELALAPDFFLSLAGLHPEIASVDISPRRGRHPNEMNRFRYQVVIRTRPFVPLRSMTIPSAWESGYESIEDIRRRLVEGHPRELVIGGVPNARLARERELLGKLRTALPTETVGELRAALEQAPSRGVEPSHLRALGEELGYAVETRWSAHGADGSFEVTFVRSQGEAPDESTPVNTCAASRITSDDLWAFANNPLAARYRRLIVSELRSHMRARLPEYMVPSSVVLIDAMPLTPNGKIDRRALQQAHGQTARRTGAYEAARDDLERQIAAIWQEVLRVDRVGVTDNFFDVGGHSLLVVRLQDRLRTVLRRDLPVTTLFQFPTIRALAQHLEQGHDVAAIDGAQKRAATRKALSKQVRSARSHQAKSQG